MSTIYHSIQECKHGPIVVAGPSLSYVEMEIQDRLEDENALSPVTVEVRHTLAILWSSKHESSHHHSQQIIKLRLRVVETSKLTHLHMHSSPPPSYLYAQHAKGSQHTRTNSCYGDQYRLSSYIIKQAVGSMVGLESSAVGSIMGREGSAVGENNSVPKKAVWSR